ncbi:unnamed protein product [Sordaria macrospora k-hell]|uniref:WGS project CABT00000000 data, contig 2.365 n=1 Tax=Sordaria macrospora (strain ATCC MYA-333 / DSM 997 / K(L3346) / K-hell) TaxID=771870 RepID=F7WCX8_SORMK|nr:uncharacterized protein SMAC_10195 [Sordaria macrospora k-hell]CCC05742.1 unnamed protein product [Sordaria macrospora k-hell]
MVFMPQALVPLLKWCRDLWYDGKPGAEEGPETLPRLHHRRQRARLRRYHATDRDRAVRMNFERTLAELTIALTDLQRTGGLPQWDAIDERYDPVERRGVQSALADAEERTVPRPVRLASLTARQREDLREHWLVQEKIIDDAIDAWFVRNDTSAGSQTLQDAAAKGRGRPGLDSPVDLQRLSFLRTGQVGFVGGRCYTAAK